MTPLRLISAAAFVSCTSMAPPAQDASTEPARDGASATSGLPVVIRRDAYGVPHIEASDDRAAFYGIGWAAAEDRLYDMHTRVLGVQGRLAEHFGPGTGLDANNRSAEVHVDLDVRARVLGSWRNAQTKAEALEPEVAALLESYAEGVNAYAAAHPDRLSPLFASQGVALQTWTVDHVVAAWHSLADNYSLPAFGEAAAREAHEDDDGVFDPESATNALWGVFLPGISEHGVVQQSDVDPTYVDKVLSYAQSLGVEQIQPRYPVVGDAGPHFSHAFALADWRTRTGGAMMVADPQLPVLLPSVWWEYQVDSPGFTARGIAVPGTPGMAVGQTDGVAWGITAGPVDQADLFRLTLDDASDTYIVDGEAFEMEVIDETILVAGEAPRTVQYRGSVWGPVVDPLLTGSPKGTYAMRSILVGEDDADTVEGMLDMMAASDLRSFVASLEGWRSPSVNLVAATSEGDVYFSVIGAMPVRRSGLGFAGVLAQSGDSLDNDWLDVAPHEVMPQVTNPASGAVYSGNHRPAGDWYPLALGYPVNGGGHSHRSARLRDLLDTGTVFDAQRFLGSVQNDCVDSSRQRFVQIANHVLDVDPSALSDEAARMARYLQNWSEHGSMRSDVPEVWLVKHLLVSFRVDQTDWPLQRIYGASEPGMVNFLDVLQRAIAADPTALPGTEELAYLDRVLTLLHDTDVGPEPEWTASWEKQMATLVLQDHRSIDHGLFADRFTTTTDVLPCAWTDTILSQPSQSYTQFVDFGARRRESVKAPGTSEGRTDDAYLAELKLWTSAGLKPAPVDAEGARAIAVETVTLTFSP